MLENRKGELSRFCYESKGTLTGQNFVVLLELLLDEARRKNDDAKIVSIYRNQGEIRSLKTLLGFFLKKPPEK